jgi:hypothetical protein
MKLRVFLDKKLVYVHVFGLQERQPGGNLSLLPGAAAYVREAAWRRIFSFLLSLRSGSLTVVFSFFLSLCCETLFI